MPDHRGSTERSVGLGTQSLDALPDDLAHAFGQAQIGKVSGQVPATVIPLHDRA
jgi:hypothetical protein